jgi:DNA-binding transcriptional LysR family regulator
MRHLDLALLRSFVAVVETGGATRAAGRVHLTQAAVSQQIRRLEDSLEQALFDREGRRLRLTAAGERLLAHARRLLSLNDEIWHLMRAPDEDGEVRLGVPLDLSDPFLAPILKTFCQQWPRVRVSVLGATTAELRAAHATGRIDLFLATEEGYGAGGEVLYPDLLVWVGARSGEAWLREPLPIAFGNVRCAFRAPVIEVLAAAGRPWRMTGDTSDMAALRACIEADIAVTALLASALPAAVALVPDEAGLPALPPFNINLYAPPRGAARPCHELAQCIRRMLGVKARLDVESRAA